MLVFLMFLESAAEISEGSVVAEKFEAMVSLGIANNRMKDFYESQHVGP